MIRVLPDFTKFSSSASMSPRVWSAVLFAILALLGLREHLYPPGARLSLTDRQDGRRIRAITIAGNPVKVFDHRRDSEEYDDYPDSQVTAWRERDGTVNLMIPNAEAYRMRGPDLEHLSMDPRKIYSSKASAHRIREDLHDYSHWFAGPYSLDGRNFYTLSHSEWYACLLKNDCEQTAANGQAAEVNSWANTVNSFRSSDGGATWTLNAVRGNYVVANVAYEWTGSKALEREIYLHDLNHSGMGQPTRIMKEGEFFYSIGYFLHRDFDRITAAKGSYQAPADRHGYVLMRSSDIADPNGWQAWAGGSNFEPLSNMTFKTFLPQESGVALDAAPAQIIYDLNAHCYILFNTLFGGSNAVYYSTTQTLARPSWSDATPIAGTADLTIGPAGSERGFNDSNYPSVADPRSAGYNFEFTLGRPLLFFVGHPPEFYNNTSARDLYRIELSISYD